MVKWSDEDLPVCGMDRITCLKNSFCYVSLFLKYWEKQSNWTYINFRPFGQPDMRKANLKHIGYFLFVGCIGLTSCSGSMTKEQRKEMLKARESTEIKKVSESMIHQAALEKGVKVATAIDLNVPGDYASIAQKMSCNIRWVSVDKSNLNTIENELIQAYKQTSSSLENIEYTNGGDSILFTKSVFDPKESILKGMWEITFSKKDLIQSM